MGEAVVGTIRAMWLFGPFNKCIFHWIDEIKKGKDSLERVEKEFLSGLLSASMKRFGREAEMEENLPRRVQFQDVTLTIYMHKGFLAVLDAESDGDFETIEPQLRRSISDAINEDPLGFGQLLSDYDMPGRSKLGNRLQSILESQHRKNAPV
jgi:hypothetical protein